ncbi:hypothetical protein Octan_059 [Acinetobacter phage Octan]|uniref:Uncharacterized protein n=2 Tax=Lazarusvirus kimel TaxID=2843635 RepID=A0A7D3QMQ3_9CAUD|nr:hypothetical protein Octan_059 [Acinetobacter phage Octan]QNO11180.1 hypothetical protein Meroveus_059 [Acinetobacter phage Meroveus]
MKKFIDRIFGSKGYEHHRICKTCNYSNFLINKLFTL